MTSTTELFTPEGALNATVTEKQATALLGKVRQEGVRVMERSSWACFIAIRAGVSNGDAASILGKSTGGVTLYRRLAVAMIAGVKPGTDTWNVLANKSKASNKPSGLAEMLDAGDDHIDIPSLDAIEECVKANFDPKGVPVKGSPADLGRPNRGADTPDGEAPPLEQAKAYVKAIGDLSKTLDVEAWSTIETALNDMIGRVNRRRVADAKADAKAEAGLAKTG